jgi:hypothetical protein
MRTTVTLDADVEKILREESHRSRKSFKEVLNAAVRSALRPPVARAPKLLPPRPMGLAKGIDPRDLGGLADEMEAEVYLKIASRRRS